MTLFFAPRIVPFAPRLFCAMIFLALMAVTQMAVAQMAMAQTAAVPEPSPPAQLPPIEAIEGPVILTISGLIDAKNSDLGAELDLKALKSLGTGVIETTTIWTRQANRFEGVPLAAVLAAVKAQGRNLRLQALNDYAYEVAIEELLQGDPILAYQMDGVALSARDKGPLWLIYPFDSSPLYQTEQHFVRAIWQLNEIEVLP